MIKKIFSFLPLVFALTVSAQQKIALLEPRAGEESTDISGMEKAMLRGELRKAIVNHTGYEAFTRSDIDQLMREQDFQRTGNVSDDDIHRMGEMSGADYLCISTLTKSNEEFYLEAFLINVETGKISSPASQYGELIGGKLANMLPVCQALAQELLGTAIPNKSQNSTTQNPVVSNNSIGEIKTFSDGSKGVVFYKTDDGHGLVVSLDVASLKWENVKQERQCHDITAVPNEDKVLGYLTFQLGLQNTNAIIQQLGMEQAPAVTWCVQHGEGWYLPSAGELWYLFVVANSEADVNHSQGDGSITLKKQPILDSKKRNAQLVNGQVSCALIKAGGRPLEYGWYWSSNEKDNDDALNVSGTGKISAEEKPEYCLVRAIRAF